MPGYPKISIVTPSFNQGKYIEQTILSIIRQGYPNLEYIIIDGGSTDDTVEIIKKYESHLSYWVSEPDRGQSDALNKGLAKCTGDIFNWINSDDYLHENSLFAVAAHFINHQSVEMVCGWCRLFDEETLEERYQHRTEIFATLEETLVEQRINQPASFYRLQSILNLGGINEHLHYVMDLDLWFRYLAANGQKHILLVDELLAHFRMHDTSKTVKLQDKFRQEENELWFQLLTEMRMHPAVTSFFDGGTSNTAFNGWNCSAVDKQRLTNSLCKKYLFQFYMLKNVKAAWFAFLNQLKLGNIGLRKVFIGIFFNLFVRRGSSFGRS